MKKSIVFLLVLGLSLLFALPASAQIIRKRSYKYKHPFDFRNFNLGFEMGLNYNSYLVKDYVNVWDEGILLDHIEIENSPGLNLGMIMNMNLHDNLNIRSIPAISLEERRFRYVFSLPTPDTQIRRVESAIFDFPLLFQVRSNLYKRQRMYFITGPQYSLNVQSSGKLRDDPSLIKVKANTLNWVFGVGMNLYGEKIKLSPELKYTIGLTNEYVPRNTSHANAIFFLYRQVLTLNILFE
ncbi:MAG: PorT family protein [Bacteroidia bacterium]|nr:PorT family protein [Bacteroidia bacterium]